MGAHGFTVYDMIARGASVHGDAPAIVQADRSLSFREFKGRADALAGACGAGHRQGERICVLAQTTRPTGSLWRLRARGHRRLSD